MSLTISVTRLVLYALKSPVFLTCSSLLATLVALALLFATLPVASRIAGAEISTLLWNRVNRRDMVALTVRTPKNIGTRERDCDHLSSVQVGAIVVYEQVRFEAQVLPSDLTVAPMRLDEQIFLAQLVLRAVRLNDAFHSAATSVLLTLGARKVAYELQSPHNFTPSSNIKLEQVPSGGVGFQRLPSVAQQACTAQVGRALSGSDRCDSSGRHKLSASLVTPQQRMNNRFPSCHSKRPPQIHITRHDWHHCDTPVTQPTMCELSDAVKRNS
jgi:hypothetical protein